MEFGYVFTSSFKCIHVGVGEAVGEAVGSVNFTEINPGKRLSSDGNL